MQSFFPLDVLDEIWDVIESVSEGFLAYFYYDCSAFWHRNVLDWTLIINENSVQTLFTVRARLAIIGRLVSLTTPVRKEHFHFGSK